MPEYNGDIDTLKAKDAEIFQELSQLLLAEPLKLLIVQSRLGKSPVPDKKRHILSILECMNQRKQLFEKPKQNSSSQEDFMYGSGFENTTVTEANLSNDRHTVQYITHFS